MRGRLVARGTERRRRWRRVVGPVVVLLVIGHDVLMAGNAHTSPFPDARHGGASVDATHPGASPATPHEHLDQRAGMHRAPAVMGGSDDGAPLPHPASCATVRSAIPQVGADGSDDFGVGDVVVPSCLHARPPAVAPCWETPTQPPRTRRALLRIYRI